mgnify:CR=1 FL=1|jgi:hypothetical protein|tara:strand:+ start:37 stop:309 length:273 start_codon:yes stop_codon:yes gene_type:complete
MNKQTENKEVKKITDEELKELQDQVNRINSAQLRLGGIESQKHTLVHGINAMQKEVQDMQVKLEEKYGKVSINITTGEITEEPQDEQANT